MMRKRMKPCVFLSFLVGIKIKLGLVRRPWPRHLSNLVTPIDFVRYREFAFTYAAIQQIVPYPGTILDVSSPKLLPLTLAYALPSVEVFSTDILPDEVNWVKNKAKKLNLSNLTSMVLDARTLPFEDCVFDLVTSISVFEHIAPENDGELPAVKEVARVLKSGGLLVLTVPFSRSYFAEYVNRSVYERAQSSPSESLFFQRFYDLERLKRTFVEQSGLKLEYLGFIYERFFSYNPHRRLAHYINASQKQKVLFGPLYPLLSQVFLSTTQPLRDKGKPYIACLVLKKV